MISKLSKEEFYRRIKSNTKIGNPEVKATPLLFFTTFTQTSRRFFGEYNKSSFRLTKNALFFPASFIIDGTYKSKANKKTKVNFKTEMIFYSKLMLSIIFLGFLIGANFGIIPTFNNQNILIYLVGNLIIIIPFLIVFLILRNQKKVLERIFKGIFEIESDKAIANNSSRCTIPTK